MNSPLRKFCGVLVAMHLLSGCSDVTNSTSSVVQKSVGITCDKILSNRVNKEDIEKFVLHSKWEERQKIDTIFGIFEIIDGLNDEDPVYQEGSKIIKDFLEEIIKLNNSEKDEKEESSSMNSIMNQTLIKLLILMNRGNKMNILFPKCLPGVELNSTV